MTAFDTTDSAISDAALVQRAADRDHEAVRLLYQRHSTLIYSVLMEMLGEPEEAQDILHDLFAGLLTKGKTYDPSHGKPVGWLVTLARNQAIDRLRRRASHRRYVTLITPTVEASQDSHTGPHGDEVELLHECVAGLPPDQRQTLHFAYFGGLTQQEISEKMKHPLGTVKAWIRRGLLKLRDCLEGRAS